MELTKRCCTCEVTKPITEFYKDRGASGGYEARCKVCRKASVKMTRARYRERYIQRTCAWGKANRGKCRIYEQAYYAENKEKVRQKNARWRHNNPDKWNAIVREGAKRLRKSRPELFRAWDATKRANRLKRVPPWADLKVIAEFYKNRPAGMVVDHVIPLQGKNVSGLHVSWNLQYLTPFDNGRKNNKV